MKRTIEIAGVIGKKAGLILLFLHLAFGQAQIGRADCIDLPPYVDIPTDWSVTARDWSRGFTIDSKINLPPAANSIYVLRELTSRTDSQGGLVFQACARKKFDYFATDWQSPFLLHQEIHGFVSYFHHDCDRSEQGSVNHFEDYRQDGPVEWSGYPTVYVNLHTTLSEVNESRDSWQQAGLLVNHLDSYGHVWKEIRSGQENSTGFHPSVAYSGIGLNVSEEATAAGPVTRQVYVHPVMFAFTENENPISGLFDGQPCGSYKDVSLSVAPVGAYLQASETLNFDGDYDPNPTHYPYPLAIPERRVAHWYGPFSGPNSFEEGLMDIDEFLQSINANYNSSGGKKVGELLIFDVVPAHPPYNGEDEQVYTFQVAVQLGALHSKTPIYVPNDNPANPPSVVVPAGGGAGDSFNVCWGESIWLSGFSITPPPGANSILSAKITCRLGRIRIAGGNESTEITLTNTAAGIQSALNSLVYTSPNMAGTDAITVTVTATDATSGMSTSATSVIVVSISDCSVGCTPAPDDLVGWWRGQNNANDSIGGDNGTLQGGAGFANGKVGRSFQFDGVDDFVEIPSQPQIEFSGPFTVEAWIKYTGSLDPNFGNVIVTKGQEDGSLGWLQDWTLAVDPNGKLAITLAISWDFAGIECNTTLNANTWYHVAMVYDGTQMQGFVNGQPDGAIDLSGGVIWPTQYPVRIGAFAPVTGTWNRGMFSGLIDEVSLYDRALTASEVLSIFQAGSGGKCQPTLPQCTVPPSGLVSWWKGQDNAADNVSGNNGALLNGATFTAGKVGQGFQFDGQDDCVSIPDSASLDSPTFTVETWLKPLSQVDDWINQENIFAQGYGLQLCVRGSGDGMQVVFLVSDDSPIGYSEIGSSQVIPIGRYSHLAGSWDGTTLRLYINGQLEGEYEPGTSLVPSNCNYFIGGFYNACGYTGQFFHGIVDEMSYYNRALSAQEVQSIYNAGNAGKCTP
jgi:hypothetical protein